MNNNYKITLFAKFGDDMLKPISDFLIKLTYMGISFFSIIAAIVALFYIIKLAFTIKKAASELEEDKKRKAITSLVWVICGFVVCLFAGTIFGILLNMAGQN